MRKNQLVVHNGTGYIGNVKPSKQQPKDQEAEQVLPAHLNSKQVEPDQVKLDQWKDVEMLAPIEVHAMIAKKRGQSQTSPEAEEMLLPTGLNKRK